MNQKKLIALLAVLVVFINYENYMSPDMQKLYSKIGLLETRIEQEESIKKNIHEKELKIDINYQELMYSSKKYNYSQAMGKFQEDITMATKDLCNIEKILWAQVSSKELWYEKLRMNVFLNCTPHALHETANNLKAKGKLYYAENFLALKLQKKNELRVRVQLVAFRNLNEAK